MDLEAKSEVFLTKHNHSKQNRAWLYFFYFWLVFGVGTFIGQFIPGILLFPITIGLFVLIAITLFSKKLRFGLGLSSVYAFLIGVLSYTSFKYYINDLGDALFYQVILLAIAAFAITGILGYFFFKDTSSWGRGLFVVLVAVVVMSFIGIFIHIPMFQLVISVISLGLFLMYNIYDFNRMKRDDYNPVEMGFNLFINLLNLIMDLLRIVSYFKD